MNLNKSPSFSGSKVELVRYGELVCIKKTCKPNQVARFHLQIEKQKQFSTDVIGVYTPKVLELGTFHAMMEFIPALTYIDFVETTPVETVKLTLRKLLYLLKEELFDAKDVLEIVPLDAVYVVANKETFPKKYINLAFLTAEKFGGREPLCIPKGKCHGDLTMSNILFKGEEIYLLDFLDVPKSPFFDLAKVRQDAKYHWTSHTTMGSHDYQKVRIIDSWLHGELPVVFSGQQHSFRFVEALNYLRIFPYVYDKPDICIYLENIIKEIIQ